MANRFRPADILDGDAGSPVWGTRGWMSRRCRDEGGNACCGHGAEKAQRTTAYFSILDQDRLWLACDYYQQSRLLLSLVLTST